MSSSSSLDAAGAKLDSIELWMLESALGLNRASALISGRPQRLYHVLRRIRTLQYDLVQQRHALRAWSAELRALLRLPPPTDAAHTLDDVHDLIGAVSCILGSFQPDHDDDGPRPASLTQAQTQWLRRAHDLLRPDRRRPPPQTDSSSSSDDDDASATPILDDQPTTSRVANSEPGAPSDDSRTETTTTAPLAIQIRDQIPRLRHVDPRPDYRPPMALGAVVPAPGALLNLIRAQKTRLRSVPTRISCVQVGRVVSQRSQSATRAPSPETTPSEGETKATVLVPRSRTMPLRRRRLGRRGEFEQRGAAVQPRQIRSPSIRLASA